MVDPDRRPLSGALPLAVVAAFAFTAPIGAAEDDTFRLIGEEQIVTGANQRPQPQDSRSLYLTLTLLPGGGR